MTAPRFNAMLGPAARVTWETPASVFDPLHAEFGFTVDVAASAENARVAWYFDELTDGLRQSWAGERVWCNPPYGRAIGAWPKKASRREAEVAVLLLPARTDTAWWHDFVAPFAEVRFVRGRIRFRGAPHSAPFGSAICIYRHPEGER